VFVENGGYELVLALAAGLIVIAVLGRREIQHRRPDRPPLPGRSRRWPHQPRPRDRDHLNRTRNQ
jgi:hypothetical protein